MCENWNVASVQISWTHPWHNQLDCVLYEVHCFFIVSCCSSTFRSEILYKISLFHVIKKQFELGAFDNINSEFMIEWNKVNRNVELHYTRIVKLIFLMHFAVIFFRLDTHFYWLNSVYQKFTFFSLKNVLINSLFEYFRICDVSDLKCFLKAKFR